MSSKRHQRRVEAGRQARACTGKVRFGSERIAEAALLSASRFYGDCTMTVYPCRHCGSFHLGHVTVGYRRAA